MGLSNTVHAVSQCWEVASFSRQLSMALLPARRAALAATRYPRVTCTAGDSSESEAEVELDDDVGAFEPLDAARVPVITTVSQVCGALREGSSMAIPWQALLGMQQLWLTSLVHG